MKLYDSDTDQEYLLDGRYLVKPITRCKDCKWFHPGDYRYYDDVVEPFCEVHEKSFDEEDFCSYAERKEE